MLDEIIGLLRENVDELEDVTLDADTSLIASGYMDSYEVVTLLMKLEQAFCRQERSSRWRTNSPIESTI